jgi:hypothetical protein
VANSIKDDLDLSVFEVEHCGADAALAMSHIHASQAVFKNSLEILELYTRFVNEFDTLCQHLNCSGNFDIGITRRIKCFENFIGPPGKGKNMGLYYCYLLWENAPTKFTTHRLGDEVGRSSVDGTSSTESVISAGVTLSKNDQKKVLMVRSIFGGTSPSFLSPPHSNDSSQYSSSDGKLTPDDLVERKRLLKLRAEEVESNMSSVKVQKLSNMMKDPSFQWLSKDKQDSILNAWFEEYNK